MSSIIIVSELGLLPPTERWPRLVAPQAEQLDSSGLGRIVDLDSMRHEATELGRIEAEELAVELRDLGYGREVVNMVISAAGVTRPNSHACDPASVQTVNTLFRAGDWHRKPWRFGNHHERDHGYSDHFPVTVRLKVEGINLPT